MAACSEGGGSMKLLQELLHKEQFSDTEQSIVDFLLEHHREVAELSARQLAEKAYTSSASVVRFCQRLVFKGYADFKIRFVAEAMQTDVEQGISLSMSNKDTVPSVIDKVTRLSMDVIQETRYLTEPAMLVRTVHLIEQADGIDFYAIGNNQHLSDLAGYALLQTGKFSTAHHTAAALYMQAMATKKGRLGFLISRTGENRRLIEIAHELRKRSAKFVLLTAEKHSTLANLAEETLVVAAADRFNELGSYVFLSGAKYMIDLISGVLLTHHYKDAVENHAAFQRAYSVSN